MNIHVVKMHTAYETYIRSLHLTEKGALLEFCGHVADTLLEHEFEKEEVELIDEVVEYVKQDGTTLGMLKHYKEVLDDFCDRVEMWPEIIIGTLLP